MSRLAKWWLIPAFLFVCPSLVHAQSCTSATCNATDCSRNSVLAALPANSNSNAAVVVNIPAGTCHWGNGSAFVYNAPSAVKNLTIQGQTVCTGSGDPAQNNLTCTDKTIIVDDDATTTGQDDSILLSIGSANSIRITGITFNEGSNVNTNNAMLVGSGSPLRIDHNHFNMDTYTSSLPIVNPIEVASCTNGVADHNVFDSNSAVRTNSIYISNGDCGGDKGDSVWAAPSQFGSGQFFFVEANTFNFTVHGAQAANDCTFGGRYVWRFNTMYNEAHIQTHPTGSSGGRGCRAQEVYGNSLIFNQGTNYVYNIFFYSSGTALVWGNSAQAGYESFISLHNCRSGPGACGYNQVAPPNGWGYCNGTSAWDANANSTGYPCIDQPGRGQGDLLSGVLPNVIDTVTGTATWPHQKLEPIYFWLNRYNPLFNGNGSPTPIAADSGIWTQNIDYYVSSDQNSGTDCNGFTGETGVGCGSLSARPSTCVTGVAYWATDQGSWNQSSNGAGQGQLFRCSATNTWSLYYTPYTYPHPLANGSGTLPPPDPPTHVQITVN